MGETDCPDCHTPLNRSGVCTRCFYRAPKSAGQSAPAPDAGGWQGKSAPAPHPTSSGGWASGGPTASPVSAPVPAPTAPLAGHPTYPLSPPASTAATASSRAAVGRVRLRGRICEVGAERFETVSLKGSQALGQLGTGCVQVVPRAIGVVLGVLFAPLRLLLLPSLTGIGRKPEGPDRVQVPGTPFTLEADDGLEYDCYLRGEVRGGFLRLGDEVEVDGRIDRARVVRVNSVVNRRTGAIAHGYVDPEARSAPLKTVLAGVLFVLVILFLISLIQAMGGR